MVFFINEQYLGLVGDNISLEKKIKEKDKRIEELKELLKECRGSVEVGLENARMCESYRDTEYFKELLAKIDEVLK